MFHHICHHRFAIVFVLHQIFNEKQSHARLIHYGLFNIFLFIRWLFDCFLLLISHMFTIFVPPKTGCFIQQFPNKKSTRRATSTQGRWETTTASSRFRTRRLAWVGKAQLGRSWVGCSMGRWVGPLSKPWSNWWFRKITWRFLWRFGNIMVMFGVAWRKRKNLLGHEHCVHEVVEMIVSYRHTFVFFGNYIMYLQCKQDFTLGRHTTTRPAWRGCRKTRESNQDRERCRMAHLFSPYLVVSNIFCCSSRKLGEWTCAYFSDWLEKKHHLVLCGSETHPLLNHVFRYRVAFLSENQLWLQVTNSLTCKKAAAFNRHQMTKPALKGGGIWNDGQEDAWKALA